MHDVWRRFYGKRDAHTIMSYNASLAPLADKYAPAVLALWGEKDEEASEKWLNEATGLCFALRTDTS